MARILVAVPTFESILPDTFKSIWDMDAAGHELLFEFVRGYDCAQARINIVERARELAAGKILMVDSDVVVPRDALANLDSHGVGLCLGFYVRKDAHDGQTCLHKLGRYNFDRQYGGAELLEARERGEHLIEVKGGRPRLRPDRRRRLREDPVPVVQVDGLRRRPRRALRGPLLLRPVLQGRHTGLRRHEGRVRPRLAAALGCDVGAPVRAAEGFSTFF